MKKIIVIFFLIVSIMGCKKNSDTADNLKKITSDTIQTQYIDEKNDNIKVSFIELGSVNCVPCKMMQPVMKQVEEKYKNQVQVVFYDVWTEKDAPMAGKYGIRVIPTQIFLDSNGNEYYRHEGYFPFEELEQILKQKGVK